MKREESIRLLKATSLMLLGKDNHPVSDLYYALLDAVDALEKPEPLEIIHEEKQQDKWGKWSISEIRCPECLEFFQTDCYSIDELKTCPVCGAHLIGGA